MKKVLSALLMSLMALPAFAHHPLGGMPMENFGHGLLSGVGHPILGFDHLFFVALVGIAALFTGRKFITPGAYIAAMLVGCLMMSLGQTLPLKEAMIGLSLLILGYVVLSGRALSLLPAVAVFAGFGVFHGSAFGDAIAAQEAAVSTGVLIGYLVGLGTIQYLIAIGAGWVASNFWKVTEANAVQARLAGATVAGVGLFLTLENIEGPMLSLIAG